MMMIMMLREKFFFSFMDAIFLSSFQFSALHFIPDVCLSALRSVFMLDNNKDNNNNDCDKNFYEFFLSTSSSSLLLLKIFKCYSFSLSMFFKTLLKFFCIVFSDSIILPNDTHTHTNTGIFILFHRNGCFSSSFFYSKYLCVCVSYTFGGYFQSDCITLVLHFDKIMILRKKYQTHCEIQVAKKFIP